MQCYRQFPYSKLGSLFLYSFKPSPSLIQCVGY
nr:MAG TPA: hypothetical protein [Caudoviricetes sp.]